MLCGYQDLPQHLRQLLRRAGHCLLGGFAGSPFPRASAWPSCTQVQTHPREDDQASASPRPAEPCVSVLYLGRATADSVTENRSRAVAGYPQARGQQLPDSRETSTGKELGCQLCPSSPHPESVPGLLSEVTPNKGYLLRLVQQHSEPAPLQQKIKKKQLRNRRTVRYLVED